eukprot:1161257-Karenia_brevis.AAC.1
MSGINNYPIAAMQSPNPGTQWGIVTAPGESPTFGTPSPLALPYMPGMTMPTTSVPQSQYHMESSQQVNFVAGAQQIVQVGQPSAWSGNAS